MVKTPDKVRENYLRRQAKRLGLGLKKSKAKKVNVDNLGEYMIIDLKSNSAVSGGRYDMDIEDVAAFLSEYEKNITKGTKS